MKPTCPILVLCFFLFISGASGFGDSAGEDVPAGYSYIHLDESCMFKNCMCYYVFHDDTAGGIWTGQCVDCAIDIATEDPMALVDCPVCVLAMAVYEGICIYDSETNDDWATGENYCNDNNVLIKFLYMLWDGVTDRADPSGFSGYMSGIAQDRIYNRLKEDDEIDCWLGCMNVPYVDLWFSTFGTITYADPRVAFPGEEVRVKTRLYNKGQCYDINAYDFSEVDKTPLEKVKDDYKIDDPDFDLTSDDCRLWRANVTHELWQLVDEGLPTQRWLQIDYSKIEEDFGGLYPTQFREYDIPLTLPNGRYSYKLKAYQDNPIKAGELQWEDPGCGAGYRHELSNEISIPIIVSDSVAPDLEVTSMSISPQHPIQWGGPLTVTATVRNNGQMDMQQTVSGALLLNGRVVRGTTIPDLGFMESATITFEYQVTDIKGMTHFRVMADAYNRLREPFEDDNSMSRQVLISPRVPNKPSIIELRPMGATAMGVRWAEDPDPRLETYRVYMGDDADYSRNTLVNSRMIREVAAGSAYAAATGDLVSGESYYFQVEVENDIGESSKSDIAWETTDLAGDITITKPEEGAEFDYGEIEVWAEIDDPENLVEYVDFSSPQHNCPGAVRDLSPEAGVWKGTLDFTHIPYGQVTIKAFGRGSNMKQIYDEVKVTVENPQPHSFYTQDKRNARGLTTMCAYSQNIQPRYVGSVDLYLDDVLKASLQMAENATWWEVMEWCHELDTTQIEEGEHTFTAKMMTPSGQLLYNDSSVFHIDNVPDAAILINSPAAGSSVSGKVNITARVVNDDRRTDCVKFYFDHGNHRTLLGEVTVKTGDDWVTEWETRELFNRFPGDGWLEAEALEAVIPNIPCSELGSNMVASYHQPASIRVSNEGDIYSGEVVQPKGGDQLYRSSEIVIREHYNFAGLEPWVAPSLMHADGTPAYLFMAQVPIVDGEGRMDFDTTHCHGVSIPNGRYYLKVDAPETFESGIFTIDNDNPPAPVIPPGEEPDLTFEGGLGIPGLPVAGKPVNITAVLKNIGGSPVRPPGDWNQYKIFLGIFANGHVMYGGRFEAFGGSDPNFDPGESKEVSFIWRPPAPGDYKIELGVDTIMYGHNFNYVRESNGNNNIITTNVRVLSEDDIIGGLLDAADLLLQSGVTMAGIADISMDVAEEQQEAEEEDVPEVPDEPPEEEEPSEPEYDLTVEGGYVLLKTTKGEIKYYVVAKMRSLKDPVKEKFKVGIGPEGGPMLFEESVSGLSARVEIKRYVRTPDGFDEDDEVCVTIDREDAIAEIDEDNNVKCFAPEWEEEEPEPEEPEGEYCCERYKDTMSGPEFSCVIVSSESECESGGYTVASMMPYPEFECMGELCSMAH